MPKGWWIGLASVLVITWSWPSEAAVYQQPGSLAWNWSEVEDCQQFDSCVFIEVRSTHKCEEQLLIDAAITDANDDWVANVSMVINSPRQSGTSLIEVGVNREDFEYFLVGDVSCTTGVPTVEDLL